MESQRYFDSTTALNCQKLIKQMLKTFHQRQGQIQMLFEMGMEADF